MKLRNFVAVLILLFLVCSCQTVRQVEVDQPDYLIPDNLDTVHLVDDFIVNEFTLQIQDLRWRLRAENVRFIVGVITEDEYKIRADDIGRRIDDISEALDEYTKSLLD